MTAKMNAKQRIISLILMVSMMIGMISPQLVSATSKSAGNGNISDMNVSIGDNGALTISGESGMTSATKSGAAWTNFIAKYRNFIIGISGIGAVSMILFFIFQLLKLGATAGNPQARSQALTGLIWSGVAAAGLGSVTIIVGFFYSSLR